MFDGMDRVLEELNARGLHAGIVTNKAAWLTEPLLEEMGLRQSFSCVVSGDTVAERKPHPLPMLHAAKLTGVDPGECIYVGDAERDIQAARARTEGKPEKILDKIVEGRLAKFYEEVCLLEQPFVKEATLTIEQLVKTKIAKLGENMSIARYIRFKVGETAPAGEEQAAG